MLTRNNFLVYHYPAAIHSKLEGLIEQLHQLYNNKSSYGNKILGRSFLAQFFVEVNAHNNDPNIFSFSRSNKDLGLIALVDHYVKNHLDSQITIADLSEYFYLNRYYFMHLFKEATGITIYQYILKLRLDAAEEMIKSGTSLTNASQRCGFCDYSNYYRCFKKEYGKSPKEYYNSPELSSIIGKTSGK